MNGSLARGEMLYSQIVAAADSEDWVERLLYLDSKTYLPGDILTKVDRMSMANSLEARAPLPTTLSPTDEELRILREEVDPFGYIIGRCAK